MTEQAALSPALQPPHGLILSGPVWGLDPSTQRLAAAVLHPRFRPVPQPPAAFGPGDWIPVDAEFGKEAYVAVDWRTQSYSQSGTMEARLARGLGELLRFFTKLRDDYGAPHGIYLEEPFGGMEKFNPKTKKKELVKPHPNAFYFVGLVRCALGHLFAEPEVQLIGPPAWKAKALGTGHGFAEKPEIMRWAQAVGYTGALEDEADAIGIATAGAVILSL